MERSARNRESFSRTSSVDDIAWMDAQASLLGASIGDRPGCWLWGFRLAENDMYGYVGSNGVFETMTNVPTADAFVRRICSVKPIITSSICRGSRGCCVDAMPGSSSAPSPCCWLWDQRPESEFNPTVI